MNCEEIQSKLSRYVDGQLVGNERWKVEKHLETCAECREFLEKLKKLEAMADDFEISAGDDYWRNRKDAVLEKIEQVESEKIIPIRRKQRKYAWYSFAAVAASIALVAVISIFESRDLTPTESLFKTEKKDYIDFSQKSSRDAESRGRQIDSSLDKEGNHRAVIPQIAPDTGVGGLMEAEVPAMEKAAPQEGKAGIPKPVEIDEETVEELKLTTTDDMFEPTIIRESQYMAPSVDSERATESTQYAVERKIPKKEEQALSEKTPKSDEKRAAESPVFQSLKSIPAPALPESINVTEEATGRIIPSRRAEEDEELMMEFDVEVPTTGLSRVDIDPLAFADFTDEEKQLYDILRQKVDNLNRLYGDLLSSHYEEAAAKSRLQLSGDSLSQITMEMAEAYHDLGMLTPVESERVNLLSWLRKLLRLVRDDRQERVEDYISDLEQPGNR